MLCDRQFALPAVADDIRDAPIIMYSSGKNASMFNAIPRLLHSFYSARSRREHVKVFPKPT